MSFNKGTPRKKTHQKKKVKKSSFKKSLKKIGGFLRELFSSNSVTSAAPTCDSSTSSDSCSQYNKTSQTQQQQQSDSQNDTNAQTVTSAPDSTNSSCGGTDSTQCSTNNYNQQHRFGAFQYSDKFVLK